MGQKIKDRVRDLEGRVQGLEQMIGPASERTIGGTYRQSSEPAPKAGTSVGKLIIESPSGRTEELTLTLDPATDENLDFFAGAEQEKTKEEQAEFKVGDEVVAVDELPEDTDDLGFLTDMLGFRGRVTGISSSGLFLVERGDGDFWSFKKHWLRPAPKADGGERAERAVLELGRIRVSVALPGGESLELDGLATCARMTDEMLELSVTAESLSHSWPGLPDTEDAPPPKIASETHAAVGDGPRFPQNVDLRGYLVELSGGDIVEIPPDANRTVEGDGLIKYLWGAWHSRKWCWQNASRVSESSYDIVRVVGAPLIPAIDQTTRTTERPTSW